MTKSHNSDKNDAIVLKINRDLLVNIHNNHMKFGKSGLKGTELIARKRFFFLYSLYRKK